jgi:release factor glutamine methyltransferase
VTSLAELARKMTIAHMRLFMTQSFRQRGIEHPDLDARVVIGHALSLDHTGLAAQADRLLTEGEICEILVLMARRTSGCPVARIVGVKEFWSLPLKLNAETLVPRPETETVVELALEIIDRRRRRAQPLRIADLGTGTGALLLALLSELRAARGIGTDISVGALDCAHDNARALGLAARSDFVACDFASALAGPFDLIVVNPPYIAHGEIAGLAPEVRDHDPVRALDGGTDGLDAYRTIAATTGPLLAPDGVLIVELGAGQAAAVADLFAAAGLVLDGPPRRDLAGIERALAVSRLP